MFRGIRFVFLDRDGVINRKALEGKYVYEWRQFDPLPGVESAIESLNRAGISVIVVSNQRGIALGQYTRADVDRLHAMLQSHLAGYGAHIDAFYVCPHDRDECNCRKPKTGLLEQAFRDFPEATTANSILIGDSLSDIQAAQGFGMPSILIQSDSHESHSISEKAGVLAAAVARSLVEAVKSHLV
jgi:D-glycero-D-manno-heptose 1,7-bisphosphate phosphatase